MPFTANLNSDPVAIDDYNQNDRGLDFRCRFCDEKMMLVFPDFKVNHFRHYSNSCGHGESQEHLIMKKFFYDFFKLRGGTTTYEKYLSDDDGINVIDVYLERGPVKIAIECQKSAIPFDEAKWRTKKLSEKKIYTIWILHGSVANNRQCKMLRRFCRSMYFGRAYYLINSNIYVIGPYGSSTWVDMDKINFVRKFSTNSVTRERFRIAMFNEGKFW